MRDRGNRQRRTLVAVFSLAAGIGLSGCAQQRAQEPPDLQALLGAQLQPPPGSPSTIELVERALAEDRVADAQRLMERIRATEPEDSRQRLLSAELALASGQIKPAHDRFVFLLDDKSVAPRALQGVGITKLLLGQSEEARVALARAVEADPGMWRAWNALGYAHDREQKFAEATEAYGKAIAAKSDYAIAYNNRGFSLLMQGQVDAAMRDLNRAVALDPKLVTARQNMRLAFAWRGDYSGALIGVEPRDMGRALNNIGYVAMMRGDIAAAEAYLLRAMEIEPAYNEAAARNLAYLRSIKGLGPGTPARRPG